MLKELKGKQVVVNWLDVDATQKYRLEDYCEMTDGVWIKLRHLDSHNNMTWYRFSKVESIGRVP